MIYRTVLNSDYNRNACCRIGHMSAVWSAANLVLQIVLLLVSLPLVVVAKNDHDDVERQPGVPVGGEQLPSTCAHGTWNATTELCDCHEGWGTNMFQQTFASAFVWCNVSLATSSSPPDDTEKESSGWKAWLKSPVVIVLLAVVITTVVVGSLCGCIALRRNKVQIPGEGGMPTRVVYSPPATLMTLGGMQQAFTMPPTTVVPMYQAPAAHTVLTNEPFAASSIIPLQHVSVAPTPYPHYTSYHPSICQPPMQNPGNNANVDENNGGNSNQACAGNAWSSSFRFGERRGSADTYNAAVESRSDLPSSQHLPPRTAYVSSHQGRGVHV
ncbi:hypothetical protein TRVL_01757 [Trypanosoma vivax]|nr:hypothetical protein TRVL_01757 [Trypanosoma vivax]